MTSDKTPFVGRDEAFPALPLRQSEQTPSRIDTADGFSISVNWTMRTAGDISVNPYAEAERFTAYIVKACNAHHKMVEALEACQKALAMLTEPGAIKATTTGHAWAHAVEAEAKARAALSPEGK